MTQPPAPKSTGTPDSHDLAEELALEATCYVEQVGWKFLMEPYTVRESFLPCRGHD